MNLSLVVFAPIVLATATAIGQHPASNRERCSACSSQHAPRARLARAAGVLTPRRAHTDRTATDMWNNVVNVPGSDSKTGAYSRS
jgi:hypothetical protein